MKIEEVKRQEMLKNKYLSNFSFNTNQTYINDSYIQNIEEDEPGFANEL